MTHRVLVPLDGSAFDEAILPQARRIAGPGGEIHLLHVIPSFTPPVGTVPARVMALPEEAVRYLEQVRLRLPGSTGTEIVRSGDPADRILQVALEINIDLIAMCTHARRPVTRWLLGSVAENVVLKSSLPVFLVPPGCAAPRDGLRRILVPISGLDSSRTILDTVKPLASASRAEVVLLRVVPDMHDPNFVPDPHYPSTVAGDPAEHNPHLGNARKQRGRYDSAICRNRRCRPRAFGPLPHRRRAVGGEDSG